MTIFEPAIQATTRARSLKTLVVMLLACLLMVLGAAQLRVTVMRVQAEAGLQRLFENEVHSSGPALQLHKEEKLDRKPYEHHELQEASELPPVLRRSAAPTAGPIGPSTPPYAPRGPPATA